MDRYKQDPPYQRFEVIRELGRGGFCRTLLVRDHERGDRQYALKVPLTSDTEESIVRELMNAGALRALSHPNIVKCIDFAKYDGYFAMLLEYVEGSDLRAIVGPMTAVRRPMDVGRALEIFEHVGNGVAAAHRASLIHSDIKPENILVREADGVAKLTDLGVSKIRTSTMSATRSVAGTLPYMAPEVFRAQVGVPSDLWSLSVTLYEMVTGRLPFLAENSFALQDLILRAVPTPPKQFNPKVTERLEEVILRGLQKDPNKRFATAEEMLHALRSENGPQAGLEAELEAAKKLFQEGREAEAEERVRALLDGHPDSSRAYLVLGGFCNARHEFAKTEQILRKGIEHCPHDPLLYYFLAPALWKQGGGKREAAVRALETCIRLGLSPNQERQAKALLASWKREASR